MPLPEEPTRAPALSNPGTLLDMFCAFEHSQSECALYHDGYRTWKWRYGELGAAALWFAQRLDAAHVGKGDKVIFWSENRPEWLAALWGCLLSGVVVIPLDFRSSTDFVTRIQKLTEARIILLGDDTELACAEDCTTWRLSEMEWTRPGAPEKLRIRIDPEDIAEIVFTSGSTGEPKGVILTHGNILASIAGVVPFLNRYRKYVHYAGQLRLLNLLPLSHMFGQVLAAFVPPMIPASVVFLRSASPGEITRRLRQDGVVAAILVPKMLETLSEYASSKFPQPAVAGLSKARRVWQHRRLHRHLGWRFVCFVVGGAALETGLEDFWAWRGYFVIQGYGLTEAAPIVSFNEPGSAKRGTVGRILPGVEVKIAPDGEILLRGANITQGYFGSPEETSRAFKDGWFHTGDYGEQSPSGHLLIRGRKKETIVTPEGTKVIPEDVEQVLKAVPNVLDAAVVGKDRVRAVLVIEPGTDPESIIRIANQKLEAHQRIRDVVVWPGVQLPRTVATGKLKRVEILNWLEQNGAAPEEVTTPIAELLKKYAPGRTVSDRTTLDDLGLSSLDRVELMTDIERTLGTEVDESAFAGDRLAASLLASPAPVQAVKFPEWARAVPARIFRRVMQASVVMPFTRHYAKIAVNGQDVLESLTGPVIFAANHESHMDTPAILAALPERLRGKIAVAMWKEYFDAYFHPDQHTLQERIPMALLYWGLAGLFHAFPLPQSGLETRSSLQYMGKLVDEGFSILIFPEGGRTSTGEIGSFQPGVGLLADRLRIPVVPVRVRGLGQILSRSAKFPTPGRARVHFGKPLSLEGRDFVALARRVEDAVRNL